jgi:hypothetical protein
MWLFLSEVSSAHHIFVAFLHDWCGNLVTNVRSEAFIVAESNNIVSGYQPCQLVKSDQCFRHHLCSWHQDLMIPILMMRTEMMTEISIPSDELT